MLGDFEPFSVIIGVGLYVYLAWLVRRPNPPSAREVGTGALLFWGIAACFALLACLDGAMRGMSPYEALTASFTTYGRIGSWAAGAHLAVITAALLSGHSLIAFLISRSRSGGAGR